MTPFKKNSRADVARIEQKAKASVCSDGLRSDAIAWSCPRCLSVLAISQHEIKCPRCKAEYATRDGIVDLRCKRHDYYFNPVPRDEMAQIVRQAADASWDDSVRRFLRYVRNPADWVDNLTVNGRYTWKLFLDLPPDGVFLDFGCGLGNLTSNIAPHVGKVVALDLTWERLEFARERFAKFNPNDRITLVAAGDGDHLPFPNAYFDCIALSGVLEWIADDFDADAEAGSRAAKASKMVMSFFGASNPRRTQIRFLRELRRILKPDGQLFVAIENRWNYEYFKGRPDHHSGLKYGALLPRFLANLYSIGSSHHPYRTYTHSFPGFRRLFAKAGFPFQEFYGLSPGYSRLREIIPVHSPRSFWKPARSGTLVDRIKRSRYFVPAFGIVARGRAMRSPPLLARLLGEINGALPGASSITLNGCVVTGKEKAVFRGILGDLPIVLKVPADQRALDGEARNWRMLEALSRQPPMADFVPRPIASGVHQGVPYFLESALRGRPLVEHMATLTRQAAGVQAMALLANLHANPETAVPIAKCSEPYRFMVSDPIAKLKQHGANPAQCDRLERRLQETLASQRWRLGLYHGDFTPSNIFVAEGEVSGVIDWECATERGLPALDAICYIESMQRISDPGSRVAGNVLRLSRWEWPSSEELAALRAFYRQFAVDPSMHEALCRLCWLRHVANQLDTATRFDRQFLERDVEPVLDSLGVDS
jgi:SAM-dependent methyltransferase/aminoglycoside phosphotransferase (APT) family kinase protein